MRVAVRVDARLVRRALVDVTPVAVRDQPRPRRSSGTRRKPRRRRSPDVPERFQLNSPERRGTRSVRDAVARAGTPRSRGTTKQAHSSSGPRWAARRCGRPEAGRAGGRGRVWRPLERAPGAERVERACRDRSPLLEPWSQRPRASQHRMALRNRAGAVVGPDGCGGVPAPLSGAARGRRTRRAADRRAGTAEGGHAEPAHPGRVDEPHQRGPQLDVGREGRGRIGLRVLEQRPMPLPIRNSACEVSPTGASPTASRRRSAPSHRHARSGPGGRYGRTGRC